MFISSVLDVVDPCYLYWLVSLSVEDSTWNGADGCSIGTIRLVPICYIAAEKQLANVVRIRYPPHLDVDDVLINSIVGPY